MSKSRGTFITAQSYLDLGLNPEWLRYYYAAKLNGTMEDIDLNLDDFVARVNSDLVGKYINIASRCAGFITKRFGGRLAAPAVPFHWHEVSIRDAYESRDYARALREVMACADQANVFVNDHAPWVLAKQDGQDEKLQSVCSTALELFRQLSVLLKPVLPHLVAEVERFLNIAPLGWDDFGSTLAAGHTINEYKHLMTRIDPKQVIALVDANKDSLVNTQAPAPAAEPAKKRSREESGRAAPPSRWRTFRSTTSRRSNCASRRSSPPTTSKAPTSCCACSWTSARREAASGIRRHQVSLRPGRCWSAASP
jgi:methionyl-tRNA synthetase